MQMRIFLMIRKMGCKIYKLYAISVQIEERSNPIGATEGVSSFFALIEEIS